MNKKQLIIGALALLVTVGAKACPITVKNDTNVPIYIITPALAEKLTDVVTGQQIKKMAQKLKIKKSEYEKVRVDETDTVGNGDSKTYYFYVKAGESKQYIRLYQLQFTSCIPSKQRKRWWRKNKINVSQLKKDELTEEQQKYLKLTDLRRLFGYKFTKSYSDLRKRLFNFWNEKAPKSEPMIEDLE